jgi:glycosyltransferase involved in cell wall biosynthesis
MRILTDRAPSGTRPTRRSRGRRRLLIVSRESPPSLGPATIRVSKLAKYLLEFGWDPVILSAPEDHAWYVDQELAEDVASVEILRIPRLLARVAPPTAGIVRDATAAPKMSSTSRALVRLRANGARALLIPDSSVLWALPAARKAARIQSDFDAVLTTAPPFSTHLVGDWLSQRYRLPWVAEYRDNWTANPLHRRHRLLQSVNTRLERRLLTHAGAVVAVSDAAAMEICQRFPEVAGRVVVAMNGYDPDDIPAESAPPVEFTIVHAGTLDERRNPRAFFHALSALAARDRSFAESARLLLLGNVTRAAVEEARESLGAARVTVGGLVSHREALIQASRAALLLGITTEAEAGTAGLTSKLFEYLALRKPILMLAPEGPARRMVETTGSGLSASPEDVPAIVGALARLYQEWVDGVDRSTPPELLAALTRRQTARQVAGALEAALGRGLVLDAG